MDREREGRVIGSGEWREREMGEIKREKGREREICGRERE